MKLQRILFSLSILLVASSLLLAACGSQQKSPATPTVASGYPAPSGGQQVTPPTQESYPSPAQVIVPTVDRSAYPSPPSGGATPVQIVKADGSTTSIDENALQGLEVTQITIANATRNGFKLSDVLQKAGVSDYQQVVVTGANSSQTLSKDQVSAGAILSFDTAGTAELSGSDLPETQWVAGVTKIEVK